MITGPRDMTLAELAKALNGTVNGSWINVRGLGHGPQDRSLGFQLQPDEPGGFLLHSLAGDDPNECRAYLHPLIKDALAGVEVVVAPGAATAGQSAALRTQRALSIWKESGPLVGSIAATYLDSRHCMPSPSVNVGDELRFHPYCPFGTERLPAMVALVRNVITGAPTGIHRTALNDDGKAKRAMGDGAKPKMILGPAAGSVALLASWGPTIGVSEGIETALSAARLFCIPVIAALSSVGLANLPIIVGLKCLMIFADHDDPGWKAAERCARRYAAAGVKAVIKCPEQANTDWNDFISKE